MDYALFIVIGFVLPDMRIIRTKLMENRVVDFILSVVVGGQLLSDSYLLFTESSHD